MNISFNMIDIILATKHESFYKIFELILKTVCNVYGIVLKIQGRKI